MSKQIDLPLDKLKHTNEEFDIEKAIYSMQNYWVTYTTQEGYKKYTKETFLEDALYGLGIALNPKEYRMITGFKKFKTFLYRRFEPAVKKDFVDNLKQGKYHG